jgi:RimJ/RimL family protein N-acetyltransferase
MTLTFKRVASDDQVDAVIRLANAIWPEHYQPIIGKEQVRYMLSTYHSAAAISDEIANQGYQYYLLFSNDEPVGYLGVKPEEESLLLSKIYILARERGKGLGNQAITFLRTLASSNHLKRITLTVNKNNSSSIAAYQKMGFRITGEVCADIGGGFVMDDFRMALPI